MTCSKSTQTKIDVSFIIKRTEQCMYPKHQNVASRLTCTLPGHITWVLLEVAPMIRYLNYN